MMLGEDTYASDQATSDTSRKYDEFDYRGMSMLRFSMLS